MYAIALIALGLFAAGITVGTVVIISIGIRREERRFVQLQRLREEQFFQTGETHPGFLPEDPPDRLTGGARWMTGLWVRRPPATERKLATW